MNASVLSIEIAIQHKPEVSWWTAAMDHTASDFKPGQIDKAGQILVRTDVSGAEMSAAQTLMNTWRSAHGHPLEVAVRALRKAAGLISDQVIIGERLKRLPSITAKLSKQPN